jgi:hypothetical protein
LDQRFSGITHVSAPELRQWLADPSAKILGEHMDTFDGLPGLSAESYPEPSVVEATDGRLWFSPVKAIAWLDHASLLHARNNLQPSVYVTGVAANGAKYPVSPDLVLPKQTENLEIDYTAPSLSVPERVSFRYRLEGIDKDWHDAGSRRHAFTHAFRRHDIPSLSWPLITMGSGARQTRLTFTVPPTFFQTGWFKLIYACSLIIALLAVYLFRVRLLTTRIRNSMFERMSERERIARDLHDTFFQGIQGLFLRFNTGTTMLAQLQSVYCLTVHRSQGSTFQTAFLDLPDIRRREKPTYWKAQQMLYVAVTRPSQRLIVVGD